MSESTDLKAFSALCEERHLSERYGVSVVVIACEHCHVMFERDRQDGRRVTITDRRAAVEHARLVHGLIVEATPRIGEGSNG